MPVLNATAVAAQYRNDADLFALLPEKPKFIEALELIVCGDNGILIIGGLAPKYLQSNNAVPELLSHIKSIDGSKLATEYFSESTSGEGQTRFELLCLLDRYGFLEDFQPDVLPHNQESDKDDAFFKRFLNGTRLNRDYRQAKKRLGEYSIIVGVPNLIEEHVKRALGASGLEQFLPLEDFKNVDPQNSDEYIGLSISFSGQEDYRVTEMQRMWHARNISYFHMDIGEDTVRVGPFCMPGLTASAQCSRLQLPPLKEVCNFDGYDYWVEYFIHELVLLISKVSSNFYLNSVQNHHLNRLGMSTNRLKVAMIPGGENSGLINREVLPPFEPSFEVWRHHVGIRLPPRDYLSPGAHLYHYSSENMARYKELIPQHAGVKVEIQNFDKKLKASWLSKQKLNSLSLQQKVLMILQISVGNYGPNYNKSRRISPSGGGLRSVTAFVVIRTSRDDLKLYSYDQYSNSLVRRNVDDSLDFSEKLPLLDKYYYPNCAIFFVSNVDRVKDKYGDFSLNIAYLDSGISYRFAQEAASSMGLTIINRSKFSQSHISSLLGFEGSSAQLLVTDCMEIRVNNSVPIMQWDIETTLSYTKSLVGEISSLGSSSVSRNDMPLELPLLSIKSESSNLMDILRGRRAQYAFSDKAISGALVEELIKVGKVAFEELVQSGFPKVRISPWILRPIGDFKIDNGLFRVNWSQNTIDKVCEIFPDDMKNFINQVSLSRSPLIFSSMFDFEHAIASFGPSGYRYGLLASANVLGKIWLAASAAGLGGTTAGGVVEAGYRNFGMIDGYTETPLFSLALGWPQK